MTRAQPHPGTTPTRIPADWPHRALTAAASPRVGSTGMCSAWASGPTLLLLHGSGGFGPLLGGRCCRHWRAHATVVVPDLPGHGWTLVRTAWRQQLSLPAGGGRRCRSLAAGARRCPPLRMVVGHSAGAALALRWALSQAQRPPRPAARLQPLAGAAAGGLHAAARAAGDPGDHLVAGGGAGVGLGHPRGAGAAPARHPPARRLDRQNSRPATRPCSACPEHVRGTHGLHGRGRPRHPDGRRPSPLGTALPLRDRRDATPGCHAAPLRRLIARALPEAGVEAWAGGHLLHEVEPERAAATVLGPAGTALGQRQITDQLDSDLNPPTRSKR